MRRRSAAVPAVVMAACILLYIGGAEIAFYALLGVHALSGAVLNSLPIVGQGLYGVLIVGLGWALQSRFRPARYITMAWCFASLALGALSLSSVGVRGLTQLVPPVIYLILLTRPGARTWFGQEAPKQEEP